MKLYCKLSATFLFFIFIFNTAYSEQAYYAKGKMGAVSCGHPLGVKAALEILRNRGNAIDAAVACGFMMGVVDFSNSGLGGDGFALICFPNGRVICLDGSTKRPSNFNSNEKKGIKSYIGLPTAPRMMLKMMRLFGSKWPSEILAPAVLACIDGFEISSYQEKLIEKKLLDISDPKALSFLAPDGIPLRAGKKLTQPRLARTLLQIGFDGGQSFYSGTDAKELINDMSSKFSSYSFADLSSYDSKIVKPVKYKYNEYYIYGSPSPSSSEASIIYALKLLNGKYELNSDKIEYIHETAQLGRQIVNAKYNYMSYCLNGSNHFIDRLNESVINIPNGFTDTNTTHISVVDSNGLAVSMTLTLGNHFGTGQMSPLGFFYSNSLRNFFIGAKYPDNYPLNAGPVTSKSPVIVTKNNKCSIVLGGAGADRIITNVGLTLAKLLKGYSPIKSVAWPRFFLDHQNNLFLEWKPSYSIKPISKYEIKVLSGCNDYFGLISLITRSDDGILTTVADHRRDGACGVLTEDNP